MLNGKEWQQIHPEFLDDSQVLLNTCQECLTHLELISNDSDAIECLLDTLSRLSKSAENALIFSTAEFTDKLRDLLKGAYPAIGLDGDALQAIQRCLTLVDWQLELIDRRTGQMLLDTAEQNELLDKFARICNPKKSGQCLERSIARIWAQMQPKLYDSKSLKADSPYQSLDNA